MSIGITRYRHRQDLIKAREQGVKEMQPSDVAPGLPGTDNRKQAWNGLLKANCDALFQLALLLTDDPVTAEASIVAGINRVDMSRPPEKHGLAALQKAVARQAVQNLKVGSHSENPIAFAMLQSGLWPVLQIERFPRACFVLRVLLGHATCSCAQMLGVDEAAVREMLRMAVVQLHHAVVGRNSANICVEPRTMLQPN
jgi:hypothetical protein